ncbi:MAG: hydrogenase maturation protease [Candidatus Korobacteraceae bacterium]
MSPRVLVAGVGNVLFQDDGFGPHAIARLRSEYEIGEDVELLGLGTPGLDIVDYLVGRDVLIILDALSSGGEPGEILTFNHQQLREYLPNVRLSAHQPCLQQTLFTAETGGVCPKEVLLVGIVGSSFEVGTELGPEVERGMPKALDRIAEILRQQGVEIRRRAGPLPSDSWWSAQSPPIWQSCQPTTAPSTPTPPD